MGTHATITIKRIDGTSTSIYCHYDGYIEGVGVTLQLAYNTADKVEELLKLGDLSGIGYYTEPNENDEIQRSICIAYHRDRGEIFQQSGEKSEFNYIFDEKEAVWYVEQEELIDNTKACNFLDIDLYCRCKKELLLDAIIESPIEEYWIDDEFAKSGEVIEKCKEKALEARESR